MIVKTVQLNQGVEDVFGHMEMGILLDIIVQIVEQLWLRLLLVGRKERFQHMMDRGHGNLVIIQYQNKQQHMHVNPLHFQQLVMINIL